MKRTARRWATGVAATGVLVSGGVAVAAGLNGVAASTNADDPSVAELQARLAQLANDTAVLDRAVIDASDALTSAKAAEAARVAAAARAAEAARLAKITSDAADQSEPTLAPTPRPSHSITVVKQSPSPAPHASTGASGSTGGENEGEDDD